ncbi:histidine kinase [Cellulomonas sp. Marseille-Q8402]
MADAREPRPDDVTGAAGVPAGGEAPVPDEAELARVAEPAQVRRAPKIGAFIVAGVLVGALLGLLAALLVAGSSSLEADGTAFISVLEGQGSARFISALAGAVVGGFAGAGLALLADRRSVRRAERDRRR